MEESPRFAYTKRESPKNYRLINLLSIISKRFEVLVLKTLNGYIKKHDLLRMYYMLTS